MNNFDYRFDTVGSSALKPLHLADGRLSVVEGGARDDADRPCSLRGGARRAYEWYVSAPAPVCGAPIIGDRERLGTCVVFFAVMAIVLLGAFI